MKTVTGESLPSLPERNPVSHKGSYGKVSVIGGSLGMAGAVCLAARGAVKAGAGLVEAVVPERIIDIVSIKLTVCTAAMLSSDSNGIFSPESGNHLSSLISGSSVAAVGPGMRTGAGPESVLRAAVDCGLPLVIDADGLNNLALAGPELISGRKQGTVLTPHPGEMARLTGSDISRIQQNRESAASELSEKLGCVTVLKGNSTAVTDGSRMYINTTGNPGMACGGSGDVLTGLIAGLMASSGFRPFEAACTGVWIHGAAGDLAREETGEISMSAENIIEKIPDAIRKYRHIH